MTTEQSIIENNKVIAEFMGFKMAVENHHGINLIESEEGKTYDLSGLNFHTSWDWLMPVVEKIESTKSPNGFYYDVDILSTGIQISDLNNYVVQITQEEIQSTSKIEAVYYACVTFINWHNQNK